MSQSTYFDWLESSASPAVKRELEQMEKSRRSSWSSSRDVIARKYGLHGINSPQPTKVKSNQVE